jgi:hypothetical protein
LGNPIDGLELVVVDAVSGEEAVTRPNLQPGQSLSSSAFRPAKKRDFVRSRREKLSAGRLETATANEQAARLFASGTWFGSSRL